MKFHNLWIGKNQKVLFLYLAMTCSSLTLFAKISLPAVFTDNLVLQQKTEAPIWGKASANKNVKLTTSWDMKTYTTLAAEDGCWSVKVNTPAASFTPYSITISDGKAVELKNILIGEVWICSGQSNMEMPLAGWGKILNFEKEIADAKFPNIRLLHVKKAISSQPMNDVILENGGWQECSPATIPNFSSLAYFFGRNLQQSLNVPIGLINTSWGGTIVETWASAGSLSTMPDFTKTVNDIKKYSDAEQEKMYTEKMTEWEISVQSRDKGYKGKVANFALTDYNDSSWKTLNAPQMWDEQDKELSKFDGLVWYRKTINIPEKWAGKDLKLNLGLVDDIDVTFFNGEIIGTTQSCDIERFYTVPGRLVKAGQAVITMRILDTGGLGGINGKSEQLTLSLSDKQKVTLAGDWKYEKSASLNELPATPVYSKNNPNRPTVLYNAMINGLVPYAFQGAIWYQGESNESRAYQYREVFPLMINDWRKQWNKNFPFYFVQLANFMATSKEPEESNWAELREAQTKTLNLGNTGMAVIIDIGDATDIHPKNKQEVGRRLALAARAQTYGEKIAYSGPMYDSYKIEGQQIRIAFKLTDGGLKTNDGQALKGFAIAGLDHKFHWADAKIEGNEVVVSCNDVDFPIAVRYAWSNNPICNLFNGAGLPASPFRTDDWMGNTYGKK